MQKMIMSTAYEEVLEDIIKTVCTSLPMVKPG